MNLEMNEKGHDCLINPFVIIIIMEGWLTVALLKLIPQFAYATATRPFDGNGYKWYGLVSSFLYGICDDQEVNKVVINRKGPPHDA